MMEDQGSVFILPLSSVDALRKWDDIVPLLDKAMEYEDGKYSVDDVRDFVADNKAQVWVAIQSSHVLGVAVTQVVDYPQKSMLLILCLAGKYFDLWDNIVRDHLVPYAIGYDCDGIEFYGRKGWIRRAAHLGFVPVHHVYELKIKDGDLPIYNDNVYPIF